MKQQLNAVNQQIGASSKKAVKMHLGNKFNQQQGHAATILAREGNPDNSLESDKENEGSDDDNKKDPYGDEYNILDLSGLPKTTLKKG